VLQVLGSALMMMFKERADVWTRLLIFSMFARNGAQA
jgi:hypothetical protein